MVTTPRSRKTKDDDGRRAQLVEAAARVIAEQGVAAATTRRIASEAGVPPGLVHYWFSGKDELLTEVVGSLLREVEQSASADSSVTRAETPEDILAEHFRRAFDNVVRADERGRQIAIYELTTWALRSDDHADLARQQYAAYRDTANRLTRSVIDQMPGDFSGDLDTLAQLVSALFDGVTLAWLADPEGTKPDLVFRLMSTLFARALTAE
ncbi:TetR/AcrR family transcriptional regulator [Streptomyces antimycoticus]|uniref:TetR/AcrR family transcriptional regulator n=1 Tax=Streptomyces antimycoticus TaxID=68175 RepID=UPI000A37B10B|nr:TetR/AcrR family transcriptional regulator [Streptomyces antimycoticus]